MTSDAFRHGVHDFAGSQHAALDRGGAQVVRYRVDLLRDERCGQRLPGGDPEGILRGDCRDRAGSKDAELMERLEIGLNSGGASRIRTGDREGDSRRSIDRKSTRLNSSHGYISYAVFCLKKKKD